MTMRLPKILHAFALAAAFLASAPVVAQDAPAADVKPAVKSTISINPAEEYLANPEWMLNLDLSTGGRVVIQLRPDLAPNHVARIKELARSGFYDGIVFHRVIEGFMAQTGDPTGTGNGGSTLPNLPAELSIYPHLRGSVSMARAASYDSANSQFFIVLQPRLALDREYTVFGRVVSGMEYVDAIHRGEPPATPSRIVQASVAADNKPLPPAAMLVEQAPKPTPAPFMLEPQTPQGSDNPGAR